MISGDFQLSAQPRTVFGKKTKQLRNIGQLPANIFGDVKQPVAVSLDFRQFEKTYDQAGDTTVIYLQIDQEKVSRPVLVDSIDRHPLSGKVLHVALRQVNLKEKITADVIIELVGELTLKEAEVALLREELEVKALPNDLPESFTIDQSLLLEVGQELTIADLKFDRSKVEVLLPENEVIAQVRALELMEEVVEEQPVVEETPVDGATPAEAPTEEKKAE